MLTRGAWRGYATAPGHALRAVFSEHGDPLKVVKLEDKSLRPVGHGEVRVNYMASPINPADINVIQGTYRLLPSMLPAVAGSEGIAVVVAVGEGVTTLKDGDWVVPRAPLAGTWRTSAIDKEDTWLRLPESCVPPSVSISVAATLSVNPCTAYRMLEDFVSLKEGDVVLQNGANSGVGQAVVQLAKARGVQTINVIREERPDLESVRDELLTLGATHVITDKFMDSPQMKDFMKTVAAPKLALNCVGGQSSSLLAKHLAPKGVLVTYGGMSQRPVAVSTASLIFNDIAVRGFWVSEWVRQAPLPARLAMYEEIAALARRGLFRVDVETVPFTRFQEALALSQAPFRKAKVLLDMRA